jgi:alkylation response protein AidB-like acyl-CoA dehydrogenase
MEMTISRDRWQLHLKTRGEHYHRRAQEMEALHTAQPEVGAGTVALSFHALAEILERARIGRLTRHQHILLRLGELIAYCECAASFARSAAQIAEGRRNAKAKHRFEAPVLAAMSRIFARDMALLVAEQGVRSTVGSDNHTPADESALEAAFKLSEIHRAQAGLMQDMDFVCDALFDRVSSTAGSPG